MTKIPNIVRTRLRHGTGQTAGEHPDANLLSAFVEKTLGEGERTTVLAHLVECADCRESVALSSSTAVSEPERKSSRRVSPAWRWVAAAVAAACLVTVIWQRKFDVSQVRVQKNPGGATRRSPADQGGPPYKAATSAVAPVRVEAKQKRRVSKGTEQQIAVAHQEARLERAAPVVAVPPQVIDGVISGVLPAPPDLSKPAEQQTVTENAQAAQPQVADRVRVSGKVTASPKAAISAVPKSGFMGTATNGVGNAQVFGTEMRAARRLPRSSALWSINASPDVSGKPSGVLQKSTDGGKTWQIAHVADGIDFREVVTDGESVWAGGSEGALFHSPDGGAHWEQIRVAGDGTTLSGTIVKIETAAPAQVRITTNSSEEWISDDRGMNWRRTKAR